MMARSRVVSHKMVATGDLVGRQVGKTVANRARHLHTTWPCQCTYGRTDPTTTVLIRLQKNRRWHHTAKDQTLAPYCHPNRLISTALPAVTWMTFAAPPAATIWNRSGTRKGTTELSWREGQLQSLRAGFTEGGDDVTALLRNCYGP